MTLITHNISTANDGLGDQLRTAFGNQNSMNSEMYTTTNGLRIDLTAAVTGASGISIVPTSPAPSGTGIASFTATQAGTYTNYGGVVVNANSFAVISRSAAGVFSISQTALDLTTYAKTTDLTPYSKTIDLEAYKKTKDIPDLLSIFDEDVEINGVVYPFAIIDPVTLKASIAIDLTGKFISFAHPFLQVDDNNYEVSKDDEIIQAWTDSNNKIAMAIYSDGTVYLKQREATATVKKMQSVFSDLNHIILNGQSLGNGNESTPAISITPSIYGSKSFSLGQRTWSYLVAPTARNSALFTLTNLTQTTSGDLGETISTGYLDAMKAKIVGINSANNPAETTPTFLFSFTGDGGRYLRELNKANNDAIDARAGSRQSIGGYYLTGIDDVTRAKAYADANGLTYSVSAVCWMQGEAEGDYRINRWDAPLSVEVFNATYKADLKAMKNSYMADIVAITGQFKKPLFLTYKTSDWVSGRAQVELEAEDTDVYMVSTLYMLPCAVNSNYTSGVEVHGASIHLSADGERWLGEQFAKVTKRINVDGENWRPLRPLKQWTNTAKNEVYIKFHVPVSPLVFDTDFLAKVENYGFFVYDNNVKKTISNVEIINGDTVKITMVAALVGTATVSYGTNKYENSVSKPILSIASGATLPNGQASTLYTFAGDITSEFIKANDGAFRLFKVGDTSKSTTIRKVELIGGNTVLTAETRENINTLLAGENVDIYKYRSWGNLRDSDNERSLYKFENSGYRTGYYPLWNWLIDFEKITIS